uniref:Uncharacterized protein n=1 Tax=Glossina pallidipes TaxID=7398 RepID=A0A1A9ZQW7_GLOPL
MLIDTTPLVSCISATAVCTSPRRDKRSEEMPPKMNRKRKAPNEHIGETKSSKLENSSLNTDYSRSSCEEINCNHLNSSSGHLTDVHSPTNVQYVLATLSIFGEEIANEEDSDRSSSPVRSSEPRPSKYMHITDDSPPGPARSTDAQLDLYLQAMDDEEYGGS